MCDLFSTVSYGVLRPAGDVTQLSRWQRPEIWETGHWRSRTNGRIEPDAYRADSEIKQPANGTSARSPDDRLHKYFGFSDRFGLRIGENITLACNIALLVSREVHYIRVEHPLSPDSETAVPAEFEIVEPERKHLVGNFWQLKIRGVLQRNVLFVSPRVAAVEARKLIDQGRTA